VVDSEARQGTSDGGATAQTWWGSAGAVWQSRRGRAEAMGPNGLRATGVGCLVFRCCAGGRPGVALLVHGGGGLPAGPCASPAERRHDAPASSVAPAKHRPHAQRNHGGSRDTPPAPWHKHRPFCRCRQRSSPRSSRRPPLCHLWASCSSSSTTRSTPKPPESRQPLTLHAAHAL
jgi:hypothetical protein